MEIEKKFLVKDVPLNLSDYESYDMVQAYITNDPVIRIRKRVLCNMPKADNTNVSNLKAEDSFILCYKDKVKSEEKINVNHEIEFPITEDAFNRLLEKKTGKAIEKTRYLIPLDEKHKIELDIFHGELEGFKMAEIEFENVEESKDYKVPEWFLKDLSGDYHFTNSYISQFGIDKCIQVCYNTNL
ncbi:MAG: adenylate cyclase [Lachnospiraceae bacterium]|nr:adenylate cyclase [Lachnospiraceae bacterium]